MKRITWTLAPLLSIVCAGELRAQVVYSYSGGGYVQGGGFGFSFQRRQLSLFGGFGGFATGRLGGPYLVDPYFGPPGYAYPPPVLMPPPELRLLPRGPTLEEATAGIDLDVAPTKPSASPELVPAPAPVPFELPGKDVSKQVPPVRPGDLAPPRKAPEVPPAPPPQPAPKLPPPEPPPPAGPQEESARLNTLGLAAFSAQAYGLAAHRFRQAIAANPKGARAHFLLAQAQFALGKYDAAVASIHAGMRLHKDWPAAPFQPRLDLYAGIEPDFADHLKRLETALAQAPKQPNLLFLLAYQLWFDGRRGEAVARFRQARAVSADPAFSDRFLAAAAPKQVVVK